MTFRKVVQPVLASAKYSMVSSGSGWLLELLEEDGLEVEDEALSSGLEVEDEALSSITGCGGGPELSSSLVRPCGEGESSKVTFLFVGGVLCIGGVAFGAAAGSSGSRCGES